MGELDNVERLNNMMDESSIQKAAEAIWRWYSAVTENPAHGPAYQHEINVITNIIRRHVQLPSVTCEACDAGYRLVTEGLGAGLHYDDKRGGQTWGVCRKVTAAQREMPDQEEIFVALRELRELFPDNPKIRIRYEVPMNGMVGWEIHGLAVPIWGPTLRRCLESAREAAGLIEKDSNRVPDRERAEHAASHIETWLFEEGFPIVKEQREAIARIICMALAEAQDGN